MTLKELALEMKVTEPALAVLQEADERCQGAITNLGIDAKPIIAIVAVLTPNVAVPPKPAPPKPEAPAKSTKPKGRPKKKGR